MIPTFGLLDWTIDEIDSIDKKKKILTNFYKTVTLISFTCQENLAVEVLKKLWQHKNVEYFLQNNIWPQNNKYLNKVIESEENGIIRIANELINQSNIELNENLSPQDVRQLYQQQDNNTKSQKFTEKQMYVHLKKKTGTRSNQ